MKYFKFNQIKEIIKPECRDFSKYFPKQISSFEFHGFVCEIKRKLEFVNVDKKFSDDLNNTKYSKEKKTRNRAANAF